MFGSILGGVGSAIGGIAGLASQGKSGKDEHKRNVRNWEDLLPSRFDERELSAPYLRQLAEMSPELYDVSRAEGMKNVNDSPEARAAQVRSIQQLQAIGDEGMPLADRLAAQDAHRSVMGSANASRQAMLSNLAARGSLSGGDAVQAALAGGQQSANLASDLGRNLVQESALRRLSGIQAAGGAAGQLRGQDVDVSQRNADIANQFARMFSEQQTQRNRDNASARAEAQGYNVQTRQRMGDTNEQNRYGTALANLNRQNQLKDTAFGQQVTKVGGTGNALIGLANQRDATNAARMQTAQSIGQGAGQAVGGALDIAGGSGGLGTGIQGYYQNIYGQGRGQGPAGARTYGGYV